MIISIRKSISQSVFPAAPPLDPSSQPMPEPKVRPCVLSFHRISSDLLAVLTEGLEVLGAHTERSSFRGERALDLELAQRHRIALDSHSQAAASSGQGVVGASQLNGDDAAEGAGVGWVLAADKAHVLLTGDGTCAGLVGGDGGVEGEVGGGTVLHMG